MLHYIIEGGNSNLLLHLAAILSVGHNYTFLRDNKPGHEFLGWSPLDIIYNVWSDLFSSGNNLFNFCRQHRLHYPQLELIYSIISNNFAELGLGSFEQAIQALKVTNQSLGQELYNYLILAKFPMTSAFRPSVRRRPAAAIPQEGKRRAVRTAARRPPATRRRSATSCAPRLTPGRSSPSYRAWASSR